MNHRWSELLASETITAAGTKLIDIDLGDPISRITVLMKLTNNGSTPTAHPALALTKAEIIDGSDILASLTGYEMQALEFYHNGKTPYMDLIYLNNVMAIMALSFDFGRFLHDTDLAFDPKRFKNPQIRLTHSLASGGSAPDSLDLRVRADVFDDKIPAPMGFLSPKEIYSYSLVSSGNEYIDLPIDYPIRKLMIMSRAEDKAPHEQFNLIKLSEESDKKVILEAYTSDLYKIIAGDYPDWIDRIFGASSASGVDHFVTPTLSPYPSINPEGIDNHVYPEASHNGGTQKIYATGGGNFFGIYSGRCPHGAIAIPMGDQNDPQDWWNTPGLTRARLKITAGSSVESSSTAQVVAQQFRPY